LLLSLLANVTHSALRILISFGDRLSSQQGTEHGWLCYETYFLFLQ